MKYGIKTKFIILLFTFHHQKLLRGLVILIYLHVSMRDLHQACDNSKGYLTGS